MATSKMTIAQDFIDEHGARNAPAAFARGLMAGDEARFKAGYTADNAYLATKGAFDLDLAEEQALCAALGAAPRCWCGSRATAINQATDATAEHFTCDEHAKDGFAPITPTGA